MLRRPKSCNVIKADRTKKPVLTLQDVERHVSRVHHSITRLMEDVQLHEEHVRQQRQHCQQPEAGNAADDEDQPLLPSLMSLPPALSAQARTDYECVKKPLFVLADLVQQMRTDEAKAASVMHYAKVVKALEVIFKDKYVPMQLAIALIPDDAPGKPCICYCDEYSSHSLLPSAASETAEVVETLGRFDYTKTPAASQTCLQRLQRLLQFTTTLHADDGVIAAAMAPAAVKAKAKGCFVDDPVKVASAKKQKCGR